MREENGTWGNGGWERAKERSTSEKTSKVFASGSGKAVPL